MPLTAKGAEIKAAFLQEYGSELGERYFYAAKNAGTIKGVDAVEGAPEAPEILTIPAKVTVKQINAQNREFWEQNGIPSGS